MAEPTFVDPDSTTLDDLMARKAEELSHDEMKMIVAALREQRSRWELNQAQGSRAIVKAKAIPVRKPGVKAAIPLKLTKITL
jgi:hypothetical protein